MIVLVAAVVQAGAPPAGLDVIVGTGTASPAGLPYSSFAGVGVGTGSDVAVLATTSGVFRPVGPGEDASAASVFAPGATIDGKVLVGTGPPAVGAGGCVVARLAFADGDETIHRRCGDVITRLVGAGDAVDTRAIRSIDAPVAAGPGGHVAFLARLSDGHTAIVRAGVGPPTAIARTGGSSPAGGTISSLRVIGVRTSGVVGFGATVIDGRDGLFEGDGASLRKVVVEGDGSLDGTIDSIEGASMNADGVFAFLGELDDIDGTRGIFRADARPALPQVGVLVRLGDPAPDVSGGTIGRFPPSLVPAINAAGAVVFRVNLSGDATGAGVFVVDAPGSVRKIVTTREELAVGTLTRLRDPVIADDGSVLVVAAPPSEGVGLFVARNGAIETLIRFGAPADVGAADQRFRFVSPSVRATAEGAALLGQHDVLLAFGAGGPPRVVAQLGAASALEGVFSEIDLPAVGFDGRIAFRGELLAGRTGQAVFVDDGDGPVAVASAGRKAPGPGRFRDFPVAVADNGASVDMAGTRVAFLASLFDTKALEGIFLTRPGRGGGRSLARTSKRAPGGGRYVSIDTPSVLDPKHYAFSGLVRDESTRQGLFWRERGRTRIVARQGLDTGTRLGGRFQAFSPPDLAEGGMLFRADVSPADRDGLFLARDTRRGLLVGTGDPDDAGGAFRTFDRPVWAGGHVVFAGSLAGVPARRGLFRLLPDGVPLPGSPPRPVVTLLREGSEAPGGGTIADVRPPTASASGALASIVRVEGGPAQQIVVRIRLDAAASP